MNIALADGFIPTPHCIAEPGLGVMGIHYINPARLMDPAINILEPEILLYVKSGDGLKLIGVEYWYSIGAPDTSVPNPAPPSLFSADCSMAPCRLTSRDSPRTTICMPGYGKGIPTVSSHRSIRM